MNIAREPGRRLNALAIVVVVIGILLVTLSPTESGEPARFSFTFEMARRGISDGILNFLLFLPFGLAVAWNGRPATVAGLVGLLLAAVIEAVQTLLPGRDPALTDILLNAGGALAGGVLARRRGVLLNPNQNTSAKLSVASVFVLAAVMIGTAYLLSPVADSALRAERHLVLPPSASDGAGDVRSLISLEAPSAREPIIVARSGNDLLLRYPSKGKRLGFDEPEYWSAGALEGNLNQEQTRVAVSRDRSRWAVQIGPDHVTMGPTVGHGWAALVYPDAIGRRWARPVSGLWLFALLFPIGFWARWRLGLVSPVVAILMLAIVPLITGLPATPLLEWGGALSGLLLGAVSYRSTRFGRAPSRTDLCARSSP